ncbi:Salp20-like protein 13 [Ixodes scapularis]
MSKEPSTAWGSMELSVLVSRSRIRSAAVAVEYGSNGSLSSVQDQARARSAETPASQNAWARTSSTVKTSRSVEEATVPSMAALVCLEDPGRTVLITFEGKTLSKYVKWCVLACKVHEYRPKPIVCYNCHCIGHRADVCPSEESYCGSCGHPHKEKEDCNTPSECRNCGYRTYQNHTLVTKETKSNSRGAWAAFVRDNIAHTRIDPSHLCNEAREVTAIRIKVKKKSYIVVNTYCRPLVKAANDMSWIGSPCSSSEDGHEQDSKVETTTQNLYERHYRNNSGLCGAQYRNSSHAEAVYNCTLSLLPPIVNETWEGIRHQINKSIPEFVKSICNFTVAMPMDFYLVYMGSNGNSDYEEDEESTDTDNQVTEELLTKAEENCTAHITGWTTEAPTTLEPTTEPQFEAIS